MSTQNREVTVDHKPYELAPVDPDAKIPQSVKDAAAKANAFYAQPAAPVPEPQPDPALAASAPGVQPAAAAPEPEPQPAAPVAAQPAAQAPSAPASDADEKSWEHKYHAMHGRFKKSQTQIGELQQQMSELGDELVRTQQLIHAAPRTAEPHQPAAPAHKLITEQDVQNYGTDIIDLAKRAAIESVSGDLAQLRDENAQLKQTVQRTAKQRLADDLTEAVPNWVEIKNSGEFKRWLSLPDVYSGRVKGELLREAVTAANAPRVLAFFKSFLTEKAATSPSDPTLDVQPVAQPPRTAAIPLDTLAAPGRARPASGSNNPGSPADKPVFTRAQVQAFYARVRTGHYNGRQAEKDAEEQQIFAAQREGRVR
jgi:hypothetical protein